MFFSVKHSGIIKSKLDCKSVIDSHNKAYGIKGTVYRHFNFGKLPRKFFIIHCKRKNCDGS